MLLIYKYRLGIYFYIPLYVAIQIGLYHSHHLIDYGIWRVVSEDFQIFSKSLTGFGSFLLIVCILILSLIKIKISLNLVIRNTQIFQHIAKFYNYMFSVLTEFHSYSRHWPGLWLSASPPLEHRSASSRRLTNFLNLLALGRRQHLYIFLRICKHL